MPTVAVSSQVSEAVYFLSVIGLGLFLAQPVYGVYSASQERSAQVVASGLAAMVDSMSPGTTVVTRLESYPGVQLSVTLSGHTIAASLGGWAATAQVKWTLPRETLSPSAAYNFTLSGGELQVEQAGDG